MFRGGNEREMRHFQERYLQGIDTLSGEATKGNIHFQGSNYKELINIFRRGNYRELKHFKGRNLQENYTLSGGGNYRELIHFQGGNYKEMIHFQRR